MDDYLAFAQDLARQGGKIILDNFGRKIDVELKPDHSPVTEVDKAINTLVIEAIQSKYPEHGVLGEEADHGTGQEELQWLVDPLDGTQCFIDGVKQSTCIIGLSRHGKLLLSVVYDPFTDRLYSAVKGQGAYCNQEPIHVNQRPLRGSELLGDSLSVSYAASVTAAGAELTNVHGTGYACMRVAIGDVSGSLKSRIDYHDVGPSSLIVEEAGGRVTDPSGSEVIYDGTYAGAVIISNGLCHDEILALQPSTQP